MSGIILKELLMRDAALASVIRKNSKNINKCMKSNVILFVTVLGVEAIMVGHDLKIRKLEKDLEALQKTSHTAEENEA